MLCERCGLRPATISFTQIINGQKSEAHLCNECAAQIGEFGLASTMGMSFQNFLSSLLNQSFWGQSPPALERSCPKCGLTYEGFRQSGRLGCGMCYETFEEELNRLFRRIQAGTVHKGKIAAIGEPQHSKEQEIERLQKELKAAVEAENYERAAELRDAIAALQREGEA